MFLKSRQIFSILFLACAVTIARSQPSPVAKVKAKDEFPDPAQVVVNGILGDAIRTSCKGRLTQLPNWNDGELIKMFGKEVRDNHNKTDWYGEHAGKWLYTAALAVRQNNDKELQALLLKTADYLVGTQDADGYLGNYSPAIRITATNVSHKRSWDAWNLSYMTLGLLQVNRYFPKPEYLRAATNIGDLLMKTFGEGKADITEYGTRHGLSSTVILDAIVELYKTTADKRYLDFAELIVKKAEAREGHRMVTVSLNGGDMENVGDGKIYQILWNMTALTKLYEASGNADYLKAVQNSWQNVAGYHLTEAGGAWGGIGKHLECFNSKSYWSPYGFIETCSIMSWIQLNKELLRMTGEARYASEIEKAAYNSLLGARYSNGVDWCYHSFSNGSSHIAHFNDCCPSSGVMALEELPNLLYSVRDNGVSVNLYTESEVNLSLSAVQVKVIQKTKYPVDGKIQLTLLPSKSLKFPLFVRIPDWSSSVVIRVNGTAVDTSTARKGDYFSIDRIWKAKDVVEIEFPMDLAVVRKTEEAIAPQGGTEIYRVNWFALTRGPLVFSANGLIDGRDREHVFDMTSKKPEEFFSAVAGSDGTGLAYEMKVPGESAILFRPYFESGSKAGVWRLTWLQSKID